MGTTDTRMSIKIPKTAEIYDILDGDKTYININKYRLLDAILAQAQLNKEVMALRLYDMFVKSIIVFYPDKEIAFDKLRPLILRAILKGERLPMEYFFELAEL